MVTACSRAASFGRGSAPFEPGCAPRKSERVSITRASNGPTPEARRISAEDTPEGFRKTLDYALTLPVYSVRVYHCLVLPDALLSRSLPHWNVDFDPRNMAMLSNHSWSAQDLIAMRDELNNRAAKQGGTAGEFWWSFRK